MRDPFLVSGDNGRHLKIAVTGTFGSGKTCFGLDAKNHGMGPVAVLSLEAGDVLFKDSKRWGGFKPLHTQSIEKMEEAIDFLAGSDCPYKTVVVDTVTGIYEELVNAKAKDDGSVNKNAWGLIKRKWKSLMAKLVNLPINVVFVVHENELSEHDEKSGKTTIVGHKLDAEKSFGRAPDFLIRLVVNEDGTRRIARVLKVRGDPQETGIHIGQTLQEPSIGMFAKAIKAGAEARIAPPEEVAQGNAAAMATGSVPPPREEPPAEEPPSSAPPAAQQKESTLAAMLKAVEEHEAFKAETHANNWWKKHKAEIEPLNKAEQGVLWRAVKARIVAPAVANG